MEAIKELIPINKNNVKPLGNKCDKENEKERANQFNTFFFFA